MALSLDGFKDVDGANNDSNTGFRKNSDLFKIRYTGDSSYLELSSQNTSETSHASYIGLTRADFAANEDRRYSASSKDKMDNDYHRYILTYGLDVSPQTSFVGKVYKSKYSRNWKKVGEMTVDDEEFLHDDLFLDDLTEWTDTELENITFQDLNDIDISE